MAETTKRRLARILDRHIRGREYGVTRLAREMGVVRETVDRWCSERTEPTGAQLLDIVTEVTLHEPARGLALIDELLGIPGWSAYRAPPADPRPGDLREEAADVTEAAARLQHVVRASTRDGIVSAAEQAQIANAARAVMRHAVEVPAVAKALGTPEQPLPLEVRG